MDTERGCWRTWPGFGRELGGPGREASGPGLGDSGMEATRRGGDARAPGLRRAAGRGPRPAVPTHGRGRGGQARALPAVSRSSRMAPPAPVRGSVLQSRRREGAARGPRPGRPGGSRVPPRPRRRGAGTMRAARRAEFHRPGSCRGDRDLRPLHPPRAGCPRSEGPPAREFSALSPWGWPSTRPPAKPRVGQHAARGARGGQRSMSRALGTTLALHFDPSRSGLRGAPGTKL